MRIYLGLGNLLAGLLSWHHNSEVLWCLIHGLLGWLYVIYYLITVGFH